MTSKKVLGWAVVGLVALGVLIVAVPSWEGRSLWAVVGIARSDGSQTGNPAPRVQPKQAPPTAKVRKTAVSDPSATSLRTVENKLPPADAPLKNILEDLKQRAADGDVHAACRLSFDLNRCHQLPLTRALVNQGIGAAATSGNQTNPGLVSVNDILNRDQAICDGITSQDSGAAWQYLLQAAQAGHVPSMVRFVVQPPLDTTNFMADFDGWQAYKAYAPGLLESAAQAGDPTAAFYMFWTNAGFSIPGGGNLFPRDPVKAVAYAIVAQRLADAASQRGIARALGKLSTEIGPTGMATAQSEADDLLRNTFNTQSQNDFRSNLVPDNADECDQ